jgi:hypothetical protein
MTATYFSEEYTGELPAEMTLKKTSIQAYRMEKIKHFMKFSTKFHRITFS